jgi:hypothetical protein
MRARATKKLSYQYSKKNLEDITDWLIKKLEQSGHKTERENSREPQDIEAKRNFLSLVWFYFSNAWIDWCNVIRDKAEQDMDRLNNIAFPLIGSASSEDGGGPN